MDSLNVDPLYLDDETNAVVAAYKCAILFIYIKRTNFIVGYLKF